MCGRSRTRVMCRNSTTSQFGRPRSMQDSDTFISVANLAGIQRIPTVFLPALNDY